MAQVLDDTVLIREYLNLQSLKNQNKQIDFASGNLDEQKQNIIELFSDPTQARAYGNLKKEELKAEEVSAETPVAEEENNESEKKDRYLVPSFFSWRRA